MKKPGVFQRLTPTGRLRARLIEIEGRVAARTLPRMDAGDRIASQVVTPLSQPRRVEDRRLLRDAQLLRAQYYNDSGGATALESAQALLAAHQHHQHFAVDESPALALMELARDLLPQLQAIESRHTVFKVGVVGLAAASQISNNDAAIAEQLEIMPPLIRRLSEQGDDPGVSELLSTLDGLDQDSRWSDSVRKIQRDVLRLQLSAGLVEDALALEGQRRLLSDGEQEQLVLLIVQDESCGKAAQNFVCQLLRTRPAVVATLEPELRSLALAKPGLSRNELGLRESFVKGLIEFYSNRPWVWMALSRLAARMSDGRRAAVAWIAAEDAAAGSPFDRDAEAADTVACVLASLELDPMAEAVMVHGAQREELIPAVATLVEAEAALRRGEEDVDELARVITQLEQNVTPVCGREELGVRMRRLRGELRLMAKRWESAQEDLEYVRHRGVVDTRLAMLLADCYRGLGEGQKALACLDIVEEAGPTRRAQAARAALAESRGQFESALQHLEAALEAPSDRGAGKRLRIKALAELATTYDTLGSGRASESAWFVRAESEVKTTVDRRRPELRPRRLRQDAANIARKLGRSDKEAELLVPLARRSSAARTTIVRTARAALRGGATEIIEEMVPLLEVRQPGDIEALTLRGLHALISGQTQSAREILESARDAGAQDATALLALARVQVDEGHFEEALDTLQRLPNDLNPSFHAAALELTALSLERSQQWLKALMLREQVMNEYPSSEHSWAWGRLAVIFGLHELRDKVVGVEAVDLISRGVMALRGAEDTNLRALRGLGALALGREPKVQDLPFEFLKEGETFQIGDLTNRLALEMVRRRLLDRRFEEARAFAELLIGEDAEVVRADLRRHEVLHAMCVNGAPKDRIASEALEAKLEGLHDATAVLMRILLRAEDQGGFSDIRWPSESDLSTVPPGLCLAAARVLMTKGAHLDQVDPLLKPLVDRIGPGAPESVVLLAVSAPDIPHPGLADVFDRCRDGVFPFLNQDLVKALEARARLLSGKPWQAPDGGSGPLSDLLRWCATCESLLESLDQGVPIEELVATFRILTGDAEADVPELGHVRECVHELTGPLTDAVKRAIRLTEELDESQEGSLLAAGRRAQVAWRTVWELGLDERAGTQVFPARSPEHADQLRRWIAMRHGEVAAALVDGRPALARLHLRLALTTPLEGMGVDGAEPTAEALAELVLSPVVSLEHATASHQLDSKERLLARARLLAELAPTCEAARSVINELSGSSAEDAAKEVETKQPSSPSTAHAEPVAVESVEDLPRPEAENSEESKPRGAESSPAMANEKASAPARSELSKAKLAIENGDLKEAEKHCEMSFRMAAGHGDHSTGREAITLLQEIRGQLQDSRLSEQSSAMEEAFAAGRFRQMIEYTGGRLAGIHLEPVLCMWRVRAHLAMGRTEAAAAEHTVLVSRCRTENHAGVDLAQLADEMALAFLAKELPEEASDIMRAHRSAEVNDLSEVFAGLQARYPEAPAVYFVGLLLCERGSDAEAAEGWLKLLAAVENPHAYLASSLLLRVKESVPS